MDASDNQRVQQLIQEVIVRFSTEFTKAYTQGLIKKVKKEIEGEDERAYQLEKAPPQTEPLKLGTLTKQGGFFKNWKVRHFIAYNEKDNYRIDYLEKEGGKVKGSISCCGYNAELFDADEEAKLGEFGIKLVGSSNRRVWHIKAANKEERDEWLQVFKTCCWKAGPPKNTDPLVAEAFVAAYWRVRWWYCLWDSYTPYGTEDERLADLLISVLNREVIYTVVGRLPSGAARGALESAIRTPIEVSVKSACGGSWTSSVTACSGMKATLEASVKQLLSPLIEQEKSIKNKIVEVAGGIINPVVAEIGGNLLKPILAESCLPISLAYAKSAEIFAEKIQAQIASSDFGPEKLESSVKYIDNYYWWNLWNAFSIIRDLCYQKLSKLPSVFFQNISYWTICYMAEDAISELFHNACYTFVELVKKSEGDSIEASLSSVMRMYAHDCRLAVKNLLVDVLRKFLSTAVQDLMMKPILAAVDPLQEAIAAIPVPGLATLIDLKQMSTECVERIVHEALLALVENGFMASMEKSFASIKI